MCLSTVTWQAKSNSNTRSKDKWSVGYKIFEIDKDKIKFPYFGMTYDNSVIIGKTYKANQKTIYTINKITYKSGFHIFPVAISCKLFFNINDEKYSNIFEVKYRKVTAIGTHAVHTKYPVDCIIAQEMRVIRVLTVDEIEKILEDEKRIKRINKRS